MNACTDTDPDGIPDVDDLDDDNDGILDAVETPSCYFTASEANAIASISTGLTISTGTTPLLFNGVLTTATPNFAFTAGQALANANLFTVTYPTPVNLTSLTIVNATSLGTSATAKLQGSVDGTTWVDLTSAAVSIATTANKVFTVNQNAGEYPSYRVLGVATATSLANPVFEITSILNAAYNPSGHPKATCSVDTDNDGLTNNLDLDSDGDGCPDAIEGGAAFNSANITATGALSGAVSTAAATSGVPTSAGTGQTIGTSQNASAQDANCPPCLAGTTAPTLSAPSVSNVCPATTVNLTTLTASNRPANTTLTWHTGTPATTANKITGTAVAAGTYYAAFFDASLNCYSGTLGSATTTVTAVVTACVDTDGDGAFDVSDLDDDNDGILDADENICQDRAVVDKTGVLISKPATISYVFNGNSLSSLVDNLDPDAVITQPTGTLSNSPWLNIEFPVAKVLTYLEVGHDLGRSLFSTTSTYKIQGSTDNSTWVDVSGALTYNNVATGISGGLATHNSNIANFPSNTNAYKYYRLYGLTASAGTGWATELYFKEICTDVDKDNDGIPNRLDLDSDGDGCSDAIEGGAAFTAVNTTATGALSGSVSSAAATLGVPTVAGTGQGVGYSQTGAINACLDTDTDGVPNIEDLDDDNDGIFDLNEQGCVNTSGTTITPIGIGLQGAGSINTFGHLPTATHQINQNISMAPNDGAIEITYEFNSTLVNPIIAFAGLDYARQEWFDEYNNPLRLVTLNVSPATVISGNGITRIDNTVAGDVNTSAYGRVQVLGSFNKLKVKYLWTWISQNNDSHSIAFIQPNSCNETLDSDSDGIPNTLDLDSDGDGCPDAIEGGAAFTAANTTATGALSGSVSTAAATSGVPTSAGTGQTIGTSQNASAQDANCPQPDNDVDGVPDATDLDDDNDGIPDTVEAANALNGGDTDGDGIPDTFDLDSDGDGILDFVEARNLTPAQIATLDANNDGRLDGAVGTDGIPDSVQATPNAGSVNYTPLDTDADGNPDFQDLDSDNDGISDVVEASPTGVNNDTNGDGKADGTVNTNGVASMPNTTALGLGTPDTDGDGKPDFRDLDSDNDGINDVVEAGLSDPDNNGIAGTGANPTDTDNDGIPDAVDGAPAVFGDASDPAPLNSDNDSIPNYRDLDSDNDTIADVIEGGNGPADTNGDGTISPTESGDTDGDGIPNAVDNAPSSFGDAGNATLPEGADTDTIPDYIDPDSDGDGINDICELTSNCALDGNSDGQVDNPTDPDGDGIPNNNGNDTVPGDFGGSTVPTPPTDTDGDGVADINDLDDDNDGIPDTVEAANALNGGDTDGDGIADPLDLDSDNDGILDMDESGRTTGVDANNDGRIDGPYGTNGLANSVETSADSGTINYTVVDTDGDGRPDYVDLDSDNDGINDVREANGTDANGDGLADGTTGTNGIRSSVVPGGLVPPDTDGDTVPDFRDLDSDNDGVNDVRENGGADSDNNGIADGTDTDGDGIRSSADGSPSFGDLSDAAPLNSDNDSVPNYRDLDSDNDTVSDVIESGNVAADTNNDGFISPLDTNGSDTDGDGIPNVIDNTPAVFGDAGNPALPEQGGADVDFIPDYLDPDSDGDGLWDIQELTGNAVYDPNGDGMVDTPQDTENDGIANIGGIDGAANAFGDLTRPDTDGDGIPDATDLDDDNDGIPDTVEMATAANGGDTDGDGILDYKDLDSDNDGILDIHESGRTTGLDSDNDGMLDALVGTDGIPDSVQTSPNSGTINYSIVDTDGDTRPDFQDLDSDNDGINDVRETNGTDVNGDGKADGGSTPMGIPTSAPAGGQPRVDTDGDGKPDFRDLDADNDGINDVRENGGTDANNDGIADGTDTDGDGIPSTADGQPGTWGDGSDPALINSDNDPIPNYRDLDSDNDTISDVIEGGNGPADTNNDGFVSPLDTNGGDSDGDGIPNSVDNSPLYGDAGNAALPEGPDADIIPDYIDVDSDGDGINDICELTSNCALDGNGDGQVDNPTDPDGDGIPNNNGNDTSPGGYGGLPAPVVVTPFQEWQNQTPDSGTGPAANQDFDRLTDLQEYAFASDPSTGVPVVLSNGAPVNGTVVAGDTGLQVAKANGAYDVSYRRPLGGRSDVTYTLQQSSDLSTWTDVTATPTTTPNQNGTETVKWTALGTAGQTGFVRMKLVLASPATTQYSWVEGWQSINVVGKYQTAAHNLVKKPVYSDTIFVASGVTLSPYAADSRDLRTYMVPTKSYYVEISNGANAGHRFDVNYAATTDKSIALNLSSVNNTATTLPAGLVGAQFLLREHVTLADVLPKEVFTGSTSPTAADQAQIFQNGVWVPYYLLDATVAGFYYWSKPGGIVNWDGLVIPPGTAVLAKHFNTASTSLICQTGEVRANVFRTSVGTGSTLHSGGYPLDDTPNARTYTVGTGFVGNTSPVGTDQIQLWLGDATPNASGYGVRYLLNAGTPALQYWSPVGTLQNLNTTPFLLRGRGQFIKRYQATVPLNLVMPRPWEPAAALPVLP